MDPITTAAAITAGSQLVGGLIDASETRSANAANRDMQYDFAQRGLQMRVADAKAAGLHPLAALGASPAQAAPSFVAGDLGNTVARAGQSVSDIVMKANSPEAKLVDLQAKALEAAAEKDFAQANYWNSEAAKTRAAGAATASGGVPFQPDLGPVSVSPPDRVTPKAPDQISASSRDASRVAAENPLWQKARFRDLGNGRVMYMVLPHSDDLGESLSEGPPVTLWPEIVRRSAEASGMTSGEWISQYLIGADVRPFAWVEGKMERWLRSYPQGKRQGPVTGKVK